MQRTVWLGAAALLLAGCGASVPERPVEGRHITAPPPSEGIPEVVSVLPPLPEPAGAQERYTIAVSDAPVSSVLFGLARNAGLNADIHPDVRGQITLTAVDQPLSRILDRIRQQLPLRYELSNGSVTVLPDRPFLRSYRIDYVNVAREATASISVATNVATTGSAAIGGSASAGGGSNDSTTTLTQISANRFWDTLVTNITGLLEAGRTGKQDGVPRHILVNREGGLITVRATDRQHREIRRFLDQVLARVQQQVLIEATVVEVALSDRYQAGVDWSLVDEGRGITIEQQLTGANLASPPVTTLVLERTGATDLFAAVKLLDRFGSLKVLSSPKLMVLNNQTAMLKVVDNRVYFTIEVDITPATDASPAITTYESTVHTVPVGFVMAVTPQIGDDRRVTLNVRPTISRILAFVEDPNPALAQAGVISRVPEIQVREVESVLNVDSGQIAVLGGLMQDSVDRSRSGVPGLARTPVFGDLFSYRDDAFTKTELIIFLRPLVVRAGGLEGELRAYGRFLPARGDATAMAGHTEGNHP